MTLTEIAQQICKEPETLTAPFEHCDSAMYLMESIYDPSVWQDDFRMHIAEIRKKSISCLALNEVFVYLTFIICTERTQNGCNDAHILCLSTEK